MRCRKATKLKSMFISLVLSFYFLLILLFIFSIFTLYSYWTQDICKLLLQNQPPVSSRLSAKSRRVLAPFSRLAILKTITRPSMLFKLLLNLENGPCSRMILWFALHTIIHYTMVSWSLVISQMCLLERWLMHLCGLQVKHLSQIKQLFLK